ncbi:hypothetical protein EON81_07785 [bacterium]|nr:MAG: hypothetical protein EON81_07785 [bacterium]
MKKPLSSQATAIIGAVVGLLVLGFGFMYFQKATGGAVEDIELAKKQAAVEHQQFQGKVPGAPPDAGAGEMAARQAAGKQ